MKDKFRENFLIVLPAAVATILLFLFLGREADFQVTGNLDYNIFRVLPYLVVLIGALAGVNVFVINYLQNYPRERISRRLPG